MIHRIMKQCTTVPDQCYAKSCSDPSKIAVFSFSCLFLAFKISTLTSFIFSVTSVSSYLVLYWQCFPLAHIAKFGCVSLVTIMRVFFRPQGSKIVQLLIFCLFFCFSFNSSNWSKNICYLCPLIVYVLTPSRLQQ